MLFGVETQPLWTKNENEKMLLIPKEITRDSMDHILAMYSILNIACFFKQLPAYVISWPSDDFKRETLSDNLSSSELSKLTRNMSK